MTSGIRNFAFRSALLGSTLAVLAACNQTPNMTQQPVSPQQSASPSNALPASAGSSAAISSGNTQEGRLVAIAPNDADLAKMHLTYKTFTVSADGASMDFVPLPPKAGNVVIGANAGGAYRVKLTDLQCAFPIDFKPSEGESFTLTAAAPEHTFSISKAGQLAVAMSDAASNNYYCNIHLTSL